MKAEAKSGGAGNSGSAAGSRGMNPLLWAVVLLGLSLSLLFWRSFDRGYVHFSNDGPLGAMVAEQNQARHTLTGLWVDLNWLGSEGISPAPSVTTLMRVLTTPFTYARILPPASLFIVGICACFCFRKFKLVPLACILGGLAVGLNSEFFSTSCWGVASQVVGFGANYLALGLLTGNGSRRQWVRVVLAGMAVGVGIMEAYDIGAIFSLFVAAYVLYHAIFMREGNSVLNAGQGVLQIVLVAVCAAFISYHSLTSLVGTQLKGMVQGQQDEQSKAAAWAFATEWSLPKAEFLQVFIPGLYGYRNVWHMYGNNQPKEDQYWGDIGASPPGLWRLSGTGYYAGVLVVLVSVWTVITSFRKEDSPFTTPQRRAIWFWTGVMFFSTLMAFGKFGGVDSPSFHAVFYELFYMLPFASAIRNPDKFMHVFTLAITIVFAYGIHGLYLAYLQNPVKRAPGLLAQFKDWLAKAPAFDRRWLGGCLCVIGAGILGGLIYASSSANLKAHLAAVQIAPDDIPGVASFSFHAVFWFVLFMALSTGLFALIFSGQFSGPRAKWGGILLGILLVIDLGRADRPWIYYWNVAYKYDADPVIKFLAEKPYEHRVALLPINPNSQQNATLVNAYGSDWKQELFPYYNIQCADIIQEPRAGIDKMEFMYALAPTNIFNLLRFWQLSNTRYILGPGDDFASKLDPSGKNFRMLMTFNFVQKVPDPSGWPVDYSAQPDPHGELGVIEFRGALPRAKLYSNWEINTNDEATLERLTSPAFDPAGTLLVSDTSLPLPSASNSWQNPGTVEIAPDYKSKRIELSADVKIPSVLFLSERYNPKWQVEVDGKPAKLLRCDFIMRGVYLEPGKHQIVFRFVSPIGTLCVSLTAIVLGLVLWGWLAFTPDTEEEIAPEQPAAAASATKSKEKAAR